MGESFNTVQVLEPPLLFVDERVIFIPKQRRLDVQNFDFKFIISMEGVVDLEIDGKPLGRLKRGDVLIVPKACKQTYIPTRRDELRLHVMRIYFDLSGLLPPSGEKLRGPNKADLPGAGHELASFLRERFAQVAIYSPPVGSGLHEWTRLIQAESEQRGPGHIFKIGAYCRLIVAELARFYSATAKVQHATSGSDQRSHASWTTELVKQFLFEHYSRSLTLNEIAWEVRLSNEHLCRRFKEQTGQTVFSYLRNLRIEAAKAYLISSKHSVTEIAHRTGFSSVTLFCRTFRKSVGLAPIDYRRRGVERISFQPTTLQPSDHIC